MQSSRPHWRASRPKTEASQPSQTVTAATKQSESSQRRWGLSLEAGSSKARSLRAQANSSPCARPSSSSVLSRCSKLRSTRDAPRASKRHLMVATATAAAAMTAQAARGCSPCALNWSPGCHAPLRFPKDHVESSFACRHSLPSTPSQEASRCSPSLRSGSTRAGSWILDRSASFSPVSASWPA